MLQGGFTPLHPTRFLPKILQVCDCCYQTSLENFKDVLVIISDDRGSCWPCSRSYNVAGDNHRLRRKTLIGILCLFLVFVVVLAIIIFAVTRDSVGTVESKEAQLGIRGHHGPGDRSMKPEDRSMKLQGEDRSSQSLHGEDR